MTLPMCRDGSRTKPGADLDRSMKRNGALRHTCHLAFPRREKPDRHRRPKSALNTHAEHPFRPTGCIPSRRSWRAACRGHAQEVEPISRSAVPASSERRRFPDTPRRFAAGDLSSCVPCHCSSASLDTGQSCRNTEARAAFRKFSTGHSRTCEKLPDSSTPPVSHSVRTKKGWDGGTAISVGESDQ